MVYVYLLECKDGSLYTGYAVDVQKRLREHRAGRGAKYTRGRGPLTVRYVELCLDKSTALKREHEIKRLSRLQKQQLLQSICLLPELDDLPKDRT